MTPVKQKKKDPVLQANPYLKCYIFPIAGKGPCSEGEQVDPCYRDPVEGQVDPCYIFPIAGKGPCTKVGQVDPLKVRDIPDHREGTLFWR